MTGGGWAEWHESLAGAAAATPRMTAEGGEAAVGAALEEAWAAMVVAVVEVQKALAALLQWASPPSSVGSGLVQKLLEELRSLKVDTVLGV